MDAFKIGVIAIGILASMILLPILLPILGAILLAIVINKLIEENKSE